MMVGCLTGNGKRPPVDGTYAFHAPGLTDPLTPDLQPDRAPGSGPFSFPKGAITDGDVGTGVAWRAVTVGETGVDVVLELGERCFIDRVVLHQSSPSQGVPDRTPIAHPGPDGIEAVGHVEPDGLSSVEVYAAPAGADGLALVGRAGRRGADVFPNRPIAVSVGVEAVELVVRLISHRRDIRLAELEIWGAGPGEAAVLPIPAKMVRLPGSPFVLSRGSVIRIGPTASDDARFAATMLAEKLQEAFGWAVPVAREEGQTLHGRTILIGKPGESVPLSRAGLPSPDLPEGYTLKVETQRVLILAADRRGLIYGVETLLQLLAAGDQAPMAGQCLIEDAPRLPFRGVHLFLPARDQIEYTKRLIRHLLVPIKMNTIFLELAGGNALRSASGDQ